MFKWIRVSSFISLKSPLIFFFFYLPLFYRGMHLYLISVQRLCVCVWFFFEANNIQSIKDPFHLSCAFSVKGFELFIESSKLLVKYMFLIHVEHIKKRQTWACKNYSCQVPCSFTCQKGHENAFPKRPCLNSLCPSGSFLEGIKFWEVTFFFQVRFPKWKWTSVF